MNSPKFNLKLLLNYLLASCVLALVLIELRFTQVKWPFYVFFGITGIAALITRWYGQEKTPRPLAKWARHITFTATITLIIIWIYIKLTA